MAATSNSREAVVQAARLIEEHKGEGTVVLDLGGVSSIADFFIISTARSGTHMAGIMRALTLFFKEKGIHPLNAHKGRGATGWLLLDCGDFIIHLMEKEQREFYDLERLWFKAGQVAY